MSKTGTPKSKGRKQGSERPTPLATRSPVSGVKADDAVKKWLTQSWEVFFPEVKNLEELSPKDQKFWINYRHAALRGHHGIADLAKTLSEGISRQLDADNKDRNKRREAEIRNVDELREAEIRDLHKRREADIENQEKRTQAELDERREKQKGEEGRANKRLEQEISERRRFLLLTTISFVATVALIALSAVTTQPLAYAGSGLGLLLFGNGLYRLGVLTPMHKPQEKKRWKGKGKGKKG